MKSKVEFLKWAFIGLMLLIILEIGFVTADLTWNTSPQPDIHGNCSCVNGTNGINGTNGHDGTDGINGINGINGTNGTNGINGTSLITDQINNNLNKSANITFNSLNITSTNGITIANNTELESNDITLLTFGKNAIGDLGGNPIQLRWNHIPLELQLTDKNNEAGYSFYSANIRSRYFYDDNGFIATNGNVTAGYYIGNGSKLTGVCLSNGSNCVSGGSSFNTDQINNNLNKSANITFNNLNLSGNLNATGNIITGGNFITPNNHGLQGITSSGLSSVSLIKVTTTDDVELNFNSGKSLLIDDGLNYAGNFTGGNFKSNNITATYYFGNGSKLTGVCLQNGSNCVSGGGFTTDQNSQLNTTGNPTFNGGINISTNKELCDYDINLLTYGKDNLDTCFSGKPMYIKWSAYDDMLEFVDGNGVGTDIKTGSITSNQIQSNDVYSSYFADNGGFSASNGNINAVNVTLNSATFPTSSTPSIKWSSTTGFYKPDSSSVHFMIAGSDEMIWRNDHSVTFGGGDIQMKYTSGEDIISAYNGGFFKYIGMTNSGNKTLNLYANTNINGSLNVTQNITAYRYANQLLTMYVISTITGNIVCQSFNDAYSGASFTCVTCESYGAGFMVASDCTTNALNRICLCREE